MLLNAKTMEKATKIATFTVEEVLTPLKE